MSLNLGAGQDRLTLGDGTNTGSVTKAETIIGGSGKETIRREGPPAAEN